MKDRTILLLFFEQLQIMLNSGVNLKKALEILSKLPINKRLRNYILLIKEDHSNGVKISESITRYFSDLPSVYTEILELGEVSGRFEEALGKVVSMLKLDNKIKNKIYNLLIYPVSIFVLNFIFFYFLLKTITPELLRFYSNTNFNIGDAIPFTTRGLFFLYYLLVDKWFISLPVISVFVLVFFLVIISKNRLRLGNTVIFKLPLIKEIAFFDNMLIMVYFLKQLIESGLNIRDSIKLIIEIIDNPDLKMILGKVPTQLENGMILSDAFDNADEKDIIPETFMGLVDSSKPNFDLTGNLEFLHGYFRIKRDNYLKALYRFLAPVSILLVGGLVLLMVLSMYLPISQMLLVISKQISL